MKRLDIMIWKYLVEDIGEFVSATDMCCGLGVSRRQLLTRITKLNFPFVEKDVEKFNDGNREEREQYFRLTCTPAEAQTCTINILSKYFYCDESAVTEVITAVPMDRPITLDEVTYPKDIFSQKDVICILGMMPSIEMTKTWSKNRYQRKDLDVQQCV